MGILPDGATPPSSRMADYVWHFYGEPGVGKTTLGNQFPSPVFISTEPGTSAMHAAAVDVGSWQDMKLVLDALQNEKRERIEAKARGEKGAMLPEILPMTFSDLQKAFKGNFNKGTK
jgi:hypothetical protein